METIFAWLDTDNLKQQVEEISERVTRQISETSDAITQRLWFSQQLAFEAVHIPPDADEMEIELAHYLKIH